MNQVTQGTEDGPGVAQQIADIERLEVHGPAAELAKLRGYLGDLNPAWFVYETGLRP